MEYITLYRKWRPQNFTDVVGQDTIVKTLENSLNNNRIAHAYLFAGPRGTGKTSMARILAKGLNCKDGPTPTPCGECSECIAIRDGMSLNVIEIDGASNRGIEDVRNLRSQVQFTPINAAYKVYIIDEVHMLSTPAFNALLKTLEEPPAHVVFIFATTDPHRMPPTILSRVQRFDFARFTERAMTQRLEEVAAAEGFAFEPEALAIIAQHADGGMRDALSILEKCAGFAEKITVSAVTEILGVALQEQIDAFIEHILKDAKFEALQVIDDLYNEGKDLSQFAHSVITNLRKSILSGGEGSESRKLAAIEQLTEAVRDMRFAADPRVVIELAVLKISAPRAEAPGTEVAQLDEKVRTLELQISKLQGQLARQREKQPEDVAVSTAQDAPRRVPQAGNEGLSKFLIESWPDYLQRLHTERLRQCEAFLQEGTPLEVVDDQAVIAFPRDRGFHKASIEQDSHREPAERVLSKLFGRQMRLKCVFQDEAGTPASPVEAELKAEAEARNEAEDGRGKQAGKRDSAAKPEPDHAAEEFLRASMETFGGKIISRPKED